MKILDETTLTEARDWLRERLNGGEKCPCCTQFAKVYRRKINSGMARALIELSRLAGQRYIHLNSAVSHISHEAAQLSWWGLIEQQPDEERRDDGGRGSWWRVTPLGTAFVANLVAVPKYCFVFDGRLMRLDDTERVTIVDALGARFDYGQLMANA